MALNDDTIRMVLASATALGFVLLMIGADVGAPQRGVITALCAVAVLGAMTFTAYLAERLSQ
jgi:hypothetical protein